MSGIDPRVLVMEGVEALHEWTRENPDARLDLAGANLSAVNLSHANLRGADLRGANLERANLTGANLEEAELTGACLRGAILFEALLRRADFGESNLSRAHLRNCIASDARFVKADMSHAFAQRANFGSADFSKARCRGSILTGAYLSFSFFPKADLREVQFEGADLAFSDLSQSNLRSANLRRTRLECASLEDASLRHADLSRASLTAADLRGSDLSHANLVEATMVDSNIQGATLRSCRVYGASAWGVNGAPRDSSLIITPQRELAVTVDSLKVAQFIYLLLENPGVRNFIDTVTSKVVLILGRFTEDRKPVLDAIRNDLRGRNLVPVLFDFDKPRSRDLTETVGTLAHMARFIIADISDPKCVPHELKTIVPELPSVPVLPLLQKGEDEYAMFTDLRRRCTWILDTHEYISGSALIEELPEVIAPANERAEELRRL